MSKLKDGELEGKVNDLVREFGPLADPQQHKLIVLAQKAQETHKKLEKSVNSLQESLDYLRVCIKYQLFDLEATRRENKYLRNLLEERNS